MRPVEEKTLSRKEIFEGKIVHLVEDIVELPNGEQSKRELVFHDDAASILALTEDKKALFVKQYRKALEKMIYEIPAGLIDPEDDGPLETAKRELEEETGYRAEDWKELYSFYSSPGFSDEYCYIYQAENLEKGQEPLAQDEDEFIELHLLSYEEAMDLYQTGEICDAKTVLALLHWSTL